MRARTLTEVERVRLSNRPGSRDRVGSRRTALRRTQGELREARHEDTATALGSAVCTSALELTSTVAALVDHSCGDSYAGRQLLMRELRVGGAVQELALEGSQQPHVLASSSSISSSTRLAWIVMWSGYRSLMAASIRARRRWTRLSAVSSLKETRQERDQREH